MVRLKLYNLLNKINSTFKSQFHYGSIKTQLLANAIDSKDSLNSTMVRLKPYRHFNQTMVEFCLNSTMVRLKRSE